MSPSLEGEVPVHLNPHDYAYSADTPKVPVLFNAVLALAHYDLMIRLPNRNWPITGDILWTLCHIGWISDVDREQWKDIDRAAYSAYQNYRMSPLRNCVQRIVCAERRPSDTERKMLSVGLPKVLAKSYEDLRKGKDSDLSLPPELDGRRREILDILRTSEEGRIVNPLFRPFSGDDPSLDEDHTTATLLRLETLAYGTHGKRSRRASDEDDEMSSKRPKALTLLCPEGSLEVANQMPPTPSCSASVAELSDVEEDVVLPPPRRVFTRPGLGRTETFACLEVK